jgi:hypothetical protein
MRYKVAGDNNNESLPTEICLMKLFQNNDDPSSDPKNINDEDFTTRTVETDRTHYNPTENKMEDEIVCTICAAIIKNFVFLW